MMSQLDTQTLENLQKHHYVYQKYLFKNNVTNDKFYTDLFKKLEILEVEGKYFALNKSALLVKDR